MAPPPSSVVTWAACTLGGGVWSWEPRPHLGDQGGGVPTAFMSPGSIRRKLLPAVPCGYCRRALRCRRCRRGGWLCAPSPPPCARVPEWGLSGIRGGQGAFVGTQRGASCRFLGDTRGLPHCTALPLTARARHAEASCGRQHPAGDGAPAALGPATSPGPRRAVLLLSPRLFLCLPGSLRGLRPVLCPSSPGTTRCACLWGSSVPPPSRAPGFSDVGSRCPRRGSPARVFGELRGCEAGGP